MLWVGSTELLRIYQERFSSHRIYGRWRQWLHFCCGSISRAPLSSSGAKLILKLKRPRPKVAPIEGDLRSNPSGAAACWPENASQRHTHAGVMPSQAPQRVDGDQIPSALTSSGAIRFWLAVVLTGIGTGIGAAALTRLLELVQRLMWGGKGTDILDAAQHAGAWRRILVFNTLFGRVPVELPGC